MEKDNLIGDVEVVARAREVADESTGATRGSRWLNMTIMKGFLQR